MAEIKNTFTQGKMNKDLDERLLPVGQYRDAMNIEISTSDGSDVGAVQNILGNLKVEESLNYYPSLPPPMYSQDTMLVSYGSTNGTPRCVGAVSDEKKDTLYYFVSTLYYYY